MQSLKRGLEILKLAGHEQVNLRASRMKFEDAGKDLLILDNGKVFLVHDGFVNTKLSISGRVIFDRIRQKP